MMTLLLLAAATIVTEPIPRGKIHLQGFDCDENAIYWGFGQEVVKTDWDGHILAEGVSRFEPDQGFGKQVLKGHIGDLCVVSGKVYATSWYLHCEGTPSKRKYIRQGMVQVFDAETMKFLWMHPVPYAIDGITPRDGRLLIRPNWEDSCAPFPEGDKHAQAIVTVWDMDVTKEERRFLCSTDSSPINGGFQTITAWKGMLWGGAYEDKKFYDRYPNRNRTFLMTADGKCVAASPLSTACGFAVVPPSRADGRDLFLVGDSTTEKLGTNGVVRTVGRARLYAWDGKAFVAAKDKSRTALVSGTFIDHVHRGGGARTRPDNTLETFVWAWEHGAGVECDCRLTKDCVAVMLHDGTLKRTGRKAPAEILTNKVSQLDYAQIKDVDVGSYLNEKYAAERVPTLDQVLAELKRDPRRTLFVDDKGIGPKRLAKVAREAGALDQVWYTSCSPKQIADWHRLTGGGKSRLWWGPGTREHTPEALAAAEKRYEQLMKSVRARKYEGVTLVCFDVHYNPKFADPFVPSSDYLRRLAAEFKKAGVVFTCIPYEGGNDVNAYLKLRELGVEGFGTDDPTVLFKAREI